MKTPTVERCIETRFFKKHRKHMPALINITNQQEPSKEAGQVAHSEKP